MFLGKCFLLSSFFSSADAFVRFEHSVLMNERDFDGKSELAFPLDCADVGCRIYVSVPKGSRMNARNIFVQDFSVVRMRLLTISLLAFGDDNSKGFYYVTKGNTKAHFLNKNKNKKCEPIAVWIVRADAPNIASAQVYDSMLYYRTPARAGVVTFMNAAPFTVRTDTRGPMTMSAYLAGFDAVDEGNCTRVVRQDDPSAYQDVSLWVSSPLLTLVFDGYGFPHTAIAMIAQLAEDDQPEFDLGKPMFATSPGYIGCEVVGGADKTYYSSLYNDSVEYRFSSDSPMQLQLSADLGVSLDSPVIITADSGDRHYLCTGDEASEPLLLETKNLTIQWTKPEQVSDEYFMMRVEPLWSETTTTAYTVPERITSTTSQKVLSTVKSSITSTTTTPTTSPSKQSTATQSESQSTESETSTIGTTYSEITTTSTGTSETKSAQMNAVSTTLVFPTTSVASDFALLSSIMISLLSICLLV